MAKKLVISGATGRMGQVLLRLLAEDSRFQLMGGIARTARAGVPAVIGVNDAAQLIRDADVLIDFSTPPALLELLTKRKAELAGTALVIGTTGLTEAVHAALDDAAQRSAVLTAANFSIGVNLLLGLVAAAARVLPADAYDVEIVEAHHRRKADAPSGTALAIGAAIAHARGGELDELRKDGRSGQTGERRAGEIGLHAVRGGDIVGEHHVHFIGPRERIEISHIAQDRSLFAEGALRAADWLAGRAPGRYSMSDVLGLSSLG